MTFDDSLWDLLDAVKLGDFFDDHNIPPIVFPIAIIAVILIAFFVLAAPPPTADLCGNLICNAGEDATTCPGDCGASKSYSIEIEVSGGDDCGVITVALLDESDSLIAGPMDTTSHKITFYNISAGKVYALVTSKRSEMPGEKSGLTDPAEEQAIRVSLPSGYCRKAAPQDGLPPKNPGSLVITLQDKDTGKPVTGLITLFDAGDSKIGSSHSAQSYTFGDLGGDAYYYVTVTATGYYDYNGRDNPVYVGSAKRVARTISMDSSAIPADATGKLEVCVYGDDKPIESSGEIGVYDMQGTLISVGKLSDCPLFRGEASGSGCYVFTLPAGHEYYAGVTIAPSGCTVGTRKGPFAILENKKEFTTIELYCSDVGSVRAAAYGDGDPVTNDCKMELYYKNGTRIKTMEMDDDEYTEYVSLSDGEKVYVYAKNVPDGYVQTESSTIKIEAGEEKTVKIDLDKEQPVSFDSCTQPARIRISGGGDTTDEIILSLAGEYGAGRAYDNISYEKPANGPYTIVNASIPGGAALASPSNSVESDVVTLELNGTTGVLSAVSKCNLHCGDRGFLDGDDDIDNQDVAVLGDILDAIAISGEPPYNAAGWPPACVDINEDSSLTQEDLDCLAANFGTDCSPCVSDYTTEICNDGYDNDCDGQTDTVLSGQDDLCDCSEATPCEMRRDQDGIHGGSPTSMERCALLSYMSGDGYKWHPVADWNCTAARSGETLQCNGSTLYCGQEGDEWVWSGDLKPQPPLTGGCTSICPCYGVYDLACSGDCSDLVRTVDCRHFDYDFAGSTFETQVGTSASCLSTQVAVMGHYEFQSSSGVMGIKLYCIPIIGGSLSGGTWTVPGSGAHNCGSGYVVGVNCNGDCSKSTTNTITCADIDMGPAIECKDDDGLDYSTRTVSTGQKGPGGPAGSYVDSCESDGRTLDELYCDLDGYLQTESHTCPNECRAGRCYTGDCCGDCSSLTGEGTESNPLNLGSCDSWGSDNTVEICGIDPDDNTIKYSKAYCDAAWTVKPCAWESSCLGTGETGGWYALEYREGPGACTPECP